MAEEQTKVACFHCPGLYGPVFLGSISNWFPLAHFSYFSIDNLVEIDAFVLKNQNTYYLKVCALEWVLL